MSKLVNYFTDETRVYIEERYDTHNLKLMKEGTYNSKPVKLGEFRLVQGKVVLVLEPDAELEIVTETSTLKPVEVKAVAEGDDIPF